MWKRKTWSRKPSPRFGARRGSTHLVTRTKRWESSALFIDQISTVPGASGTETLQYFHLASIALSLGNAASGAEARVGQTLAQMQRSIEIGGVVYDWGFYWRSELSNQASRPDASFNCFHALLSDRLINDGGNNTPASIGSWAPWTPGFPMSILSSSTPPEATDPNNAPTRIHFQKCFWSSNASRRFTPAEDLLYVPDDQHLNQNFGTVNRRLKLRLDDEQGLFAVLGVRNGPENTIASQFNFWLHGKIYYRFRQ